MNTYRIYFEFYGKKMMTSITAKTKQEAINQLRHKIEIHEVRNLNKPDNPFNGTSLEGIFGQIFDN